jgi:hypothetical protein
MAHTLLQELRQCPHSPRTNITVTVMEQVNNLGDGGPNEPLELGLEWLSEG